MVYSLLQPRLCDVRRLRKLQIVSSSFCTSYYFDKKMLSYQTICFIFSSVSFIIFWFYSLERYRLYGCRINYENGFPHICTEERMPTGIDMSCATCITVCLTFLLLSILTPIICVFHNWEQIWYNMVCNSVEHSLKEHGITGEDSVRDCQRLLLKMEGVVRKKNMEKIVKQSQDKVIVNHRLSMKIASSIYSHLYICHVYRNWKWAIATVFGITLSLFLPFSFLLAYSGIDAVCMIVASCFVYVIPFHASIVVLASVAFMCNEIKMWHLAVFLCVWVFLIFGTTLSAWWMEEHGETRLMRDVYKNTLPDHLKDEKDNDVDVCMILMGHKSSIDDITVKKFVNRLK
jgi:hypothetical protein